jgi:hypothetical protein
MDLSQIVDSMLLFVSQWCGTTLPRVMVAMLGVGLCVLVVAALWDRRARALPAVSALVVGVLMVVVALDTRVLHFLVATAFLTRIRILLGLLSFVVLVVAFESIRRSKLQERYALLWLVTGALILLCAIWPGLLDFSRVLLGTQYVTSIVAVAFTFLVLVAFHFSIALSRYHDNQSKIAQRCAILEAQLRALRDELAKGGSPGVTSPGVTPTVTESEPLGPQALRVSAVPAAHEGSIAGLPSAKGTTWAAVAAIVLSLAAVLFTGLSSPDVMVGDEVTHYYMLTQQAEQLPVPCFYARIPNAWGEDEVRRYPHANLWHYLGGMVYRFFGGSFAAVQVYQSLYWLQFLVFAYLLARRRCDARGRSAFVYVVALATIPMCTLFAVTFYQDVPVAAQVLAAFYFLRGGRWFLAVTFMALAVSFKETAVILIPVFLLLGGVWQFHAGRWMGVLRRVGVSLVVLVSAMLIMAASLHRFAEASYYPFEQTATIFRQLANVLKPPVPPPPTLGAVASVPGTEPVGSRVRSVTPYEVEIIANHPGDLRIPVNYLVYGGISLWIVVAAGVFSLCRRRKGPDPVHPAGWLWTTGLWYLLVSAILIRSAPDARFFLPGIPFVLLPLCERFVSQQRPKIWISLVTAIGLLQTVAVMSKLHDLRSVSPALRETLEFLKNHEPSPRTVFMYPEGNYRLFPVPHEWYLSYQLRDFWKASNDTRITMLQEHDVGAIVVKKHLVAPVDRDITNLGVYPDYFVEQINADARFPKVFDNPAASVFQVPARSPEGK